MSSRPRVLSPSGGTCCSHTWKPRRTAEVTGHSPIGSLHGYRAGLTMISLPKRGRNRGFAPMLLKRLLLLSEESCIPLAVRFVSSCSVSQSASRHLLKINLLLSLPQPTSHVYSSLTANRGKCRVEAEAPTEHGAEGPQAARARKLRKSYKTFGKRCPQVMVNNKQDVADYIVLLDHEGGKGVLRHKNNVAIFQKVSGDVVVSHSTLSLGGGVQDACEGITNDWSSHGVQIRAAGVRPGAPTPSVVPAAAVSITSAPIPIPKIRRVLYSGRR